MPQAGCFQQDSGCPSSEPETSTSPMVDDPSLE